MWFKALEKDLMVRIFVDCYFCCQDRTFKVNTLANELVSSILSSSLF